MLVKCISIQPTEEQAQRLGVGKNYFPGKQRFGVEVGETYLVFGLGVVDDEAWVDILLLPSRYLQSVPLCMFEILDRRLSKYWVIGLGPKGNLILRPPSIADQPYYFDDLSNGVPEVVEDFNKIEQLLQSEF